MHNVCKAGFTVQLLFELWKSKQSKMITDMQLAIFSNILGVFLFLLVVAYHYITANTTKSITKTK